MCLLWLYSVFCDTKDTFILHPPPDSWQVFLHTINIFSLLFYIYKTALLPGVLRRSESCCHKSPLPTLSLHTCLVGNFICKRPGSARFEALHERPEATRTAALHRKPQGHTPGKIRMYRVPPAHLHHDPALWADIIIEIPCFLMV